MKFEDIFRFECCAICFQPTDVSEQKITDKKCKITQHAKTLRISLS